ncbi:uncharacterized protein LOC110852540 [Folsomia candida]|uniref:uncharacterized protein LOC110852540 n=1 Tax=Folsomia candida TaxID=158441 RepID=UPI000B907632|nr:uncharacterized protein LOC110852540 [Folsomia candida]
MSLSSLIMSSSSSSCNPCCRLLSPQSATKVVAILDIIFSSTMAVFGLSYYIYFSIEESEKVPEPETIFQSVELVLVNGVGISIIGFLGVIFGAILYKGADQNCARKCHIWLLFRYIVMTWDLISFIRGLVDASSGALWIFITFTEFVVELYTLVVVYAFIRLLRGEPMCGFCQF